jgi:lipooligosaccharide transport system permease protein
VTVSEIVIAKIFSGFSHGLIKGLMVAITIFIITPFKFEPLNLLLYILFLIPGSAIFTCIGVIGGTMLDKPETIGRVEAVFIMPLIFMSGLFFPLSSYPANVVPIISWLPTTALFEGSRQALVHGNFIFPFVVLNLYITAIILFTAAVLTFRRRLTE